MNDITEIRKKSFRSRLRVLLAAVIGVIALAAAGACFVSYADDDEDENVAVDTGLPQDMTLSKAEMTTIYLRIEFQNFRLRRLFKLFDWSDGTMYHKLMKADNSPGKVGSKIMMGFGMVLVILMGSMQLWNMIERQDDSVTTALRILTAILLGILFVIYIQDMLDMIEQRGNILYTNIIFHKNENGDTEYSSTASNTEMMTEYLNSLDQSEIVETDWGDNIEGATGFSQFLLRITKPFMDKLMPSLAFLVAWLAIVITFYSILVSAYGALFELVIKKTLAPLAAATLAMEGARSGFARFLRSYLGLYVRIALLMVIVELISLTNTWALTTVNSTLVYGLHPAFGPFGVVLCTRAAGKALMSSSGGLVREIIG